MSSLTAVPSSSPEREKPRNYEEVVRAVYNDERATHENRELLLAVAYAVYLKETSEGVSPLREARRVLGRNSRGRYRYGDLVRGDVPRYEPPRQVNWHASEMSCEAPRLRPYRPRPYKPRAAVDPEAATPIDARHVPPDVAAFADAFKQQAIVHVPPGYEPPRDWRTEDGVCGANSYHRVEELDPRTGWVTAHWFCKRHTDQARRVAEQVREQNEAAPEPVPNAGGLLPVYFKADWEKVYRYFAGKSWEPPKYGLCADDWPEPGEVFKAHRRLRAVTGGGEGHDER